MNEADKIMLIKGLKGNKVREIGRSFSNGEASTCTCQNLSNCLNMNKERDMKAAGLVEFHQLSTAAFEFSHLSHGVCINLDKHYKTVSIFQL